MTRPLIALALLGVVGCGYPDAQTADETRPRELLGSPLLYIDLDTGCQYLVPVNGGITPRLSPDGTQICERPEGQKEE